MGADAERDLDEKAPAQEPKIFVYDGETFTSERQMVTRFLDDFRAAESFGATVLAEWVDVARDPVVRGGLRAVCAREQRHSELLAERLLELGGQCSADLSRGLKEAARGALAAREVSDLEKLQTLVARYADVDTAVRPIRNVIRQIEDDLETKALLRAILDEEIATLRWIATTCETLTRQRSSDR